MYGETHIYLQHKVQKNIERIKYMSNAYKKFENGKYYITVQAFIFYGTPCKCTCINVQ